MDCLGPDKYCHEDDFDRLNAKILLIIQLFTLVLMLSILLS